MFTSKNKHVAVGIDSEMLYLAILYKYNLAMKWDGTNMIRGESYIVPFHRVIILFCTIPRIKARLYLFYIIHVYFLVI